MAAKLDAGVTRDVELEVELEAEIAVGSLGPQKRVPLRFRIDHADDGVAFDLVRRAAVDLLPAVERLAVNKATAFSSARASENPPSASKIRAVPRCLGVMRSSLRIKRASGRRWRRIPP